MIQSLKFKTFQAKHDGKQVSTCATSGGRCLFLGSTHAGFVECCTYPTCSSILERRDGDGPLIRAAGCPFSRTA